MQSSEQEVKAILIIRDERVVGLELTSISSGFRSYKVFPGLSSSQAKTLTDFYLKDKPKHEQ